MTEKTFWRFCSLWECLNFSTLRSSSNGLLTNIYQWLNNIFLNVKENVCLNYLLRYFLDFWKQLADCESLPVVPLNRTDCHMLHPNVQCKNQRYLHQIAILIASEPCSSELVNRDPKSIVHSPLLMTWKRFLKLHCIFQWKCHPKISSTLLCTLWQYTYICG